MLHCPVLYHYAILLLSLAWVRKDHKGPLTRVNGVLISMDVKDTGRANCHDPTIFRNIWAEYVLHKSLQN